MGERQVRTVGVLGGGLAGWLSAAFLAEVLGPSVPVTLIDDGRAPAPGSAEATMPAFKSFARQLGWDEGSLLSVTQGAIQLGSRFVNWGALGERHFMPFGAFGADFDLIPLHQWWLKARLDGEPVGALEEHCMAAAMAAEGRFAPGIPDRRMIQSTYDHGWRLDAGLLMNMARDAATARGVTVVSGAFAAATLDADSGFVRAVALEGGETVSADLWIDCGGPDGHLIGEAVGTAFQDWSAWLPCDRVVQVACERGGALDPFSTITQRGAGWQGRWPLQRTSATAQVFCEEFMSVDAATGELFDNLDGPALGEPVVSRFVSGRRAAAFARNVVAIGEAHGTLEPLEPVALHLIQSGLTRLLALWPDRGCAPHVAAEYNRLTEAEWVSARDFLILRNATTTRTDTALWRRCKDMELPDTLQARLENWMGEGRTVSPGAVDVFPNPAWIALHVGQGRMPKACDPLIAARMDRVDHRRHLESLRRVVAETAAQMPTHAEWLAKNAPAPRARL
jgi:tryptophan halogenase